MKPWQIRTRHYAIVWVLFFLAALLVVGRSPMTLTTHFIGTDTGDTYEMARNIWWFTYASANGQLPFEQTLLGYPDGFSGLIFITVPLQYFPMWLLAFVLPLPLAYNLVALLWMSCNGLAMYVLVRDRLAGDTLPAQAAAWFAGLVYLSYSTMQAHLAEGHAGLLVAFGPPLYAWALLRLIDAERDVLRPFLLSVAFFYLSTTGHILQSIYVLLPLTAGIGLWALWRDDWRAVRRIFAVGAVSSALLLALLTPAILEASTESAYAETAGTVRFSADLLAPATPSFLHPLWDHLLAYPRRVLGTNLAEGSAYVGIVAALLAGWGVLVRREARAWLLLALFAFVLSLGPLLKLFDQPVTMLLDQYYSAIPLPFALVTDLPGLSLARTPGRFNFTLALAVSVAVGFGLHALLVRLPKRTPRAALLTIIGLLSAFTLFDTRYAPQMPLREATLPAYFEMLREADAVRAVFNVPYQHALAAKDALYLQTVHQHPLIAGQITRTTPVNPAKLAILQETLDPHLLRESGADVVIFHRERAREINLETVLADRLRNLGEPAYSDARYAVYFVPPLSQGPDFVAVADHDFTETQQRHSVYTDGPRWIDISLALQIGYEPLAVQVGGETIRQWPQGDVVTASIPWYLDERQYTTIDAAWQTVCPRINHPLVRCDSLRGQFVISEAPTEATVERVRFQNGVEMVAGSVSRALRADETAGHHAEDAAIRAENALVRVRLNWAFDEPLTADDVRFVHVLDADGQLVTQNDESLTQTALERGSSYAETVPFLAHELPSGTYTVHVGWYHRVPEGIENDFTLDGQPTLILGEVTIP